MEIQGTYNELVDQLAEKTALKTEMADAVLEMMMKNPELLDSVEIKKMNDKHHRGSTELLISGDRYYISVRRSLIPLILLAIPVVHAVIAGIDPDTIPKIVLEALPTLATVLRDGGLDDKIILLNENNGEKCILIEMLKIKKQCVTAENIKAQIGKSCDKAYQCDYKKRGKCTCGKKNIEELLTSLKERKVIKGGSTGYSYII